jgi:hypothetical protein
MADDDKEVKAALIQIARLITKASYEEVRAALLEEGINVDQLPLLTDMRPPEGQERN